ncbi:MAG: DUF362 domain-containing protein [Candidatus Omnitrophica bacterium]|nr:DUF362 domain-containing protein [Candidatus Omnitrophota bacterium]
MSKVSIVKCTDYNTANVEEAVMRSVDLLGGIGQFIMPGDKVLLKPNLLSARKPDDAVCTHPELVRAVIRVVKKVSNNIMIGDSPGSFFMIKDINHVLEKTGLRRIADEEGVEIIKFDKSGIINGYPIADAVMKADKVITIPKLKTHALTAMTGAIKNSFGMVPGLFKLDCHRNHPDPKHFVATIVDVFEVRRPDIAIMDAIVGMEGNGPAAGNPKRIGYVIAGRDSVSVDSVASEIIGIPAHKNIIINEAVSRKAGEGVLHHIEIVGEKLADAKLKRFKLPVTTLMTSHSINMLPDFLYKMFSRLIAFRPVIDEAICKKCNICKNACPVDAITITEERSLINAKRCIRCFCCHEACPYKSIYIRKNFITNILWRK